jgi:hypothetical protein
MLVPMMRRVTWVLAGILGVAILGRLGGCGYATYRYLVPQGYVGWVRVDYKLPGTPPLPTEGGAYAAKIPPSGRLATSSIPEAGSVEFYSYRGTARQSLNNRAPTDPAKVVWGGGYTYSSGGGRPPAVYEEFFIGTRQQREAIDIYGDEHPVRAINLHWGEGRNLHKADLRGANLKYTHLVGADLHFADLTRANLQGADTTNALLSAQLVGANLRSSNLQGANLIHDDLSGADLRYAKLRGADLFDAIARRADLAGADLRDTHLEGADLTRSRLWNATLAGARFDRRTHWPSGFDAKRHGAVLAE